MKKAAPFLALFLATIAISSPCLMANIEVKLSPDKPANDIVTSYETDAETGNITTFMRGTGEFRDIGQAFTVTDRSFQLTGFSWKVREADPQVEGKKFHIKVFQLPAINRAPESEPIAAETGTLPKNIHQREYITFTFQQPITLEKGKSYLLLFGFDEPTSSDMRARFLSLERSEGNAGYGRTWIYNGDVYTADNKAMIFHAYGR